MKLTPYEYQQRDIDKLVANNGTGIIATQVGGGKTLIAIETAKALNTKSNLVIAPKGTHKRAWERTIRMQIPDADIHKVLVSFSTVSNSFLVKVIVLLEFLEVRCC